LFKIKGDEIKHLLGNVSEIYTPKVNPNFRRIATPPPDPYSLFDDFDLIEDQLLFSTTNAFYDKDAGKFESKIKKNLKRCWIKTLFFGYEFCFVSCLFDSRQSVLR
jgi:hypothetical protein